MHRGRSARTCCRQARRRVLLGVFGETWHESLFDHASEMLALRRVLSRPVVSTCRSMAAAAPVLDCCNHWPQSSGVVSASTAAVAALWRVATPASVAVDFF